MVVLAICTIQVVAAQGPNQNRKAMANLEPEEIATLQTKKMTLHLDLTDAQQQDIYKINLENAKLRKAHMAERKARKENSEASKPTKEERLAMANKMLDHKIEVKAKMKKILNEEQYTKWETAMAKRERKMKDKGQKKRAGKKV
ncbi:protein of unknown function [Hyunsoonleella jejuensis]|uniref:LTXXQ motif family protein n=2 Tax=Hyunsoonleella jejuensis TaxID=419940 RepID=A0A1H9KZD4_9FLAO|nr:protein of unknown function [Hyunsoonleella jejuensis]